MEKCFFLNFDEKKAHVAIWTAVLALYNLQPTVNELLVWYHDALMGYQGVTGSTRDPKMALKWKKNEKVLSQLILKEFVVNIVIRDIFIVSGDDGWEGGKKK